MTEHRPYGADYVSVLDTGVGLTSVTPQEEVTRDEREHAIAQGQRLEKLIPGPWLLVTGQFDPSEDESKLAESRVRESCLRALGYPPLPDGSAINVLLDSRGGMLDSAFKIVLYLSRYTPDIDVYVPRRAKSASTLVALGARTVLLSPFGELGPLDTQVPDPRNPTARISALDCYRSVDYVRGFAYETMSTVRRLLIKEAGGQIPLRDLLGTASSFALGAIAPMTSGVSALDFGAWGRSLNIGEQYAELLLLDRNPDKDRAEGIARRLVYGYPHHLFPIDHEEAERIGLDVEVMPREVYETAISIVRACHGNSHVGFISAAEAEREQQARDGGHEPSGAGAGEGESPTPPAEARDTVVVSF